MACRAPTSSQTCTGSTPTGEPLSYDIEGRLFKWQNQPNPSTSQTSTLYDGDGVRVAEQTTTTGLGGGTTTTAYLGSIEEVATSGTNTTTTTYYTAGTVQIALATSINGGTPVFSYLGNDAIGSATVALDASGNPVSSQLYSPYGAVRTPTSSGTMPTDYGFTGQRADATTGLDDYVARYYDPVAGQFTSADTTLAQNGADLWGLSRYAYVEGNPTSKTDPDGHCFPLCTMLIGFAVGAVVGAAASIATQAAAGHCCDVKAVVTEAAVGAVSGAITGALGPFGGAAATIAVHTIVGAAVGGGGQLVTNAIEAKPLGDGVGLGIVVGGITGGITEGITGGIAAKEGAELAAAGAQALEREVADEGTSDASGAVADAVDGMEGAGCPMSFAPQTTVATPAGEQAIGSLAVGDPVTAYDPSSGAASTQTVQHVWINHDSDLLDVTLASAHTSAQQSTTTDTASKQQQVAVASHGLRAPPSERASSDTLSTETIHTTEIHPWLTTDKGWVPAGQLTVGEPVVREDGAPATITALRVVPGAADYYNLTVSHLHTYAVGTGQDVVHNCPDPAARRVTLRQSTKAEIQAAAPRTPDGDFIDPNTGQVIPKDGPFDYGHKPDFKWSRTQARARAEGWTREQVIEYENDGSHYQIEDPSANRSHRFE